MNSQRAGLRVAGVIFGIVCLGHLWRVIAQAEVRLGQWQVPMWPSVVAMILSGALSIWLWKLSKT